MSKTITNINNSVYDFEISLISTTKGSELILPIPKGAVEYLEIEDNLANFGVVGKCRIANFYGILEQLNVFDVKSMNCIYVKITNTDFVEDNKVNPNNTISFIALIKQSMDSSTNIVNKSINFTFEEYFVARTRVEAIDENLLTLEGTPGEIIKTLFEYSNPISMTDTKVSTLWPGESKDFFNLNGMLPLKLKITDFYDKDKIKSIFDLIQECYRYVSYETGPGLLTTTSIVENDIIKRKITLQPISDYTVGFYEKYQANQKDLAKYVTEEFIIGGDPQVNIPNTNFIDSYNLLRTDQADLLANKWIDYEIVENGVDITTQSTNIIFYSDARTKFSNNIIKGLDPNLPVRLNNKNGGEEKITIKRIHKKISSDELTACYVDNALNKSFIFDNTAITFAVQGNTYRQPGKFIKLQLKTADLLNNKKNSRSIDGFWFITGLKYLFKGDFFTNEYVCVKLHGDGLNEPATGQAQSASVASPADQSDIFAPPAVATNITTGPNSLNNIPPPPAPTPIE